MSRGKPCARACERRADRVALLRHRRGPSRAAAFRHFGDLGLREQHEIEGDLRGDAGGDRERSPELRNASPVRVPRERREPAGRARVRRGRAARCRWSPKPASVPAAPPSCAASRSRETCSSRTRASTIAVSQPAALRPNVVGTACCRSVRATISVSRCSLASAAAAAATSSASASTSASARRETSIAAVSTMSWLVAPRWTWRAASSPTEPASARTRGSARLPTARPSSTSCSKSKRSGSQALGDLGRDVRRHGAGGRPGVRERPLGVEHCLEPRPR